MTVARTTKRIQPRMAVLRCCALQRPARAATLRDCIKRKLLRGGREELIRSLPARAALVLGAAWRPPSVQPSAAREVAVPTAGTTSAASVLAMGACRITCVDGGAIDVRGELQE